MRPALMPRPQSRPRLVALDGGVSKDGCTVIVALIVGRRYLSDEWRAFHEARCTCSRHVELRELRRLTHA